MLSQSNQKITHYVIYEHDNLFLTSVLPPLSGSSSALFGEQRACGELLHGRAGSWPSCILWPDENKSSPKGLYKTPIQQLE